jgi:hypothetical protein
MVKLKVGSRISVVMSHYRTLVRVIVMGLSRELNMFMAENFIF